MNFQILIFNIRLQEKIFHKKNNNQKSSASSLDSALVSPALSCKDELTSGSDVAHWMLRTQPEGPPPLAPLSVWCGLALNSPRIKDQTN